MAIGMCVKFKVWMVLLIVHLVLVILPGFVISNKISSIIPYYSVFGVLELGDYLGLRVLRQITEDMFMAPITFIGWSFVISFWLMVHWVLSVITCHLTRH